MGHPDPPYHPDGGIAVEVASTLEMTRCTVRDNRATGTPGHGAGIYTIGTIRLTDCLIESNVADNEGGGINVSSGIAILEGTTAVRVNHAAVGGGLRVDGGGTTVTIAESCRITLNSAAATAGGGIRNDGGTVTLQGANPSPIVVDNCFSNCDPDGSVPKCSTAAPSGPCP